MKLYYSPGSCSLSIHIALREASLDFDLEKIDARAKKTASGGDYLAINPNGYVPALELDDGQILTECSAILQYIGDKNASLKLTPPAGTLERYRLQEWLSFLSTELHKGFGPLFNPTATDAFKETVAEKLRRRFGWMDRQLDGRDFLMGSQFTVADAYGFTIASWTDRMKIDRSSMSHLDDYMERVAARPHVEAAMRAEGLLN